MLEPMIVSSLCSFIIEVALSIATQCSVAHGNVPLDLGAYNRLLGEVIDTVCLVFSKIK